MKKLRYGCAVVSFCPDLTSATGASIPMAGLLVGQLGDELVAAAAWLPLPDGAFGKDRLAMAIMRDLPEVLRSHVDDAWSSLADGNINSDAVLTALHHSMRTSLHVSEILEPAEQDVSDAKDVPGILVGEISRRIVEVIQRHAPVSRPSRPAPPVSSAPVVRDQAVGAQFWKPERKQRAQPPLEWSASAE